MRTFIIAAALAVSAFAFAAPASADPVAKIDGIHTASPLTLAQYSRHRTRRVVRHSRRHHYTPGYRYRSAPHGWHRYRARPGNWRTRGCILVGPVWFCP